MPNQETMCYSLFIKTSAKDGNKEIFKRVNGWWKLTKELISDHFQVVLYG